MFIYDTDVVLHWSTLITSGKAEIPQGNRGVSCGVPGRGVHWKEKIKGKKGEKEGKREKKKEKRREARKKRGKWREKDNKIAENR